MAPLGRWLMHAPLLRIPGLLAFAAGVLVLAGAPLLEGDTARYIHIRWRADLSDSARLALEQDHGLRERRREDRSSFGYDLLDPSSGNIRSLLNDPAVEDSDGFNREAFTVAESAEPGRSQTGLAWRWGVEEQLEAIYTGARYLAVVGLLLVLGSTRPAMWAARRLPRPAEWPLWLAGRMPALTPRSFGIFRVGFAVMLGVLLLHNGISGGGIPLAEQRELHLPFTGWIHTLAAIDNATGNLQRALVVLLAAFACGFFARTTYVLLALGFNLWFCIWALGGGTHAIGMLPLALLALVIVPWHEGAGVDRWRKLPTRPSRIPYGYAPWVLALALSIGFAAAAFAKVRTGPGWILNGTVRYHFMAESEIAHVPWGLWIAARPAVAVAASGAAVVIEAIAIVGAFCGPALRLVFGMMVGGLLTGFILFHDAIWPAWWVLLIGFLPWEWTDRRESSPSSAGPVRRPLPAFAMAVAGVLVLQQIPVSWRNIEVGPYLSAYDMYSATFSSPEEFEKANGGPRFHILVQGAERESDIGDCVRADTHAIQLMSEALRTGGAIELVPADARERITSCANELSDAAAVRVLADQRTFDWENGRTGFLFKDRLLGEWPLTR